MFKRVVILAALTVLTAAPLQAQVPPPSQPAGGSVQVCGQDVPVPAALPPADSGPLLYQIVLCFDKQGGTSVIDPETYLYYPAEAVSHPERLERGRARKVPEDGRLWNTTSS